MSDRMTPIVEAYTLDLPECPKCGAWKGDPCRAPSWKTRRPHAARLRLHQKAHD